VPVGTRLRGALRNVLDSRRNFKPLPTDRKLRPEFAVVRKRIGIPASHQQLTHPRRLACAYKLAGQRLS